jgi:hypothetical protein
MGQDNIGDGAYIFSLVVSSSLLAILPVPAWLAVLGAQFDDPVSLRPERVALVLAKSFLLPLAFGLLIRWLFPATAERVGDPLLVIAEVVLTACALALLILHWDILVEARWPGILTAAGLIAISLAIGHLIGGPAEGERTVLAIACSTRHIAIAVTVAASVPGPRTFVLVVFYTLMSVGISLVYLRLAPRLHLRVSSSLRESNADISSSGAAVPGRAAAQYRLHLDGQPRLRRTRLLRRRDCPRRAYSARRPACRGGTAAHKFQCRGAMHAEPLGDHDGTLLDSFRNAFGAIRRRA